MGYKYDTMQKIEEQKKDVAERRKQVLKTAALLGVSVVVIGLGATGVVVFGKSFINRMASGETLTIGSYYGSELELGGIATSAFVSIVGAIGSCHSTKAMRYDTRSLKDSKNRLLSLKREYKLKKDE